MVYNSILKIVIKKYSVNSRRMSSAGNTELILQRFGPQNKEQLRKALFENKAPSKKKL